jgi:hypothetical protein
MSRNSFAFGATTVSRIFPECILDRDEADVSRFRDIFKNKEKRLRLVGAHKPLTD